MPVGITTNVNCGLGKSKSKGQPGNLVHNRREFDPYNIDPNLAVNNILFANRSLKETYEVAFGDSIDEHNSKQKRKDRISYTRDNYFKYSFGADPNSVEANAVLMSNKRGKNSVKSFNEMVVQIGDCKEFGNFMRDEYELQPLVDMWRSSNPNIVRFWWEVDRCVKDTIRQRLRADTHGIQFEYQSGMLFITLPSGRRLSYVKPRIGENKFGGESVTYEGVGATKKWERIESYGPKFVENIVQAVSRDILCSAMRTLRNYRMCGHVHDELIIECPIDTNVSEICEMMGRTPPWAKGLPLCADGYECMFYKKD